MTITGLGRGCATPSSSAPATSASAAAARPQTAALINALPDATVFTTGDNAYPDGTATDFANCYDPTLGRLQGADQPVDRQPRLDESRSTGYFAVLRRLGDRLARTAGTATTSGPYWHAVVLNTRDRLLAPAPPRSSGSAPTWPRTRSKNVVAYWHRPRFDSGSDHGTEVAAEAIWRALYEYGADVVVNGHEHCLRALRAADARRRGRSHVRHPRVRGRHGWRAASTRLGTLDANSEVYDGSTWGVFKLTLHEASYDWQFLPVAGWTFTDSGTQAVHAAPPVTSTNGGLDLGSGKRLRHVRRPGQARPRHVHDRDLVQARRRGDRRLKRERRRHEPPPARDPRLVRERREHHRRELGSRHRCHIEQARGRLRGHGVRRQPSGIGRDDRHEQCLASRRRNVRRHDLASLPRRRPRRHPCGECQPALGHHPARRPRHDARLCRRCATATSTASSTRRASGIAPSRDPRSPPTSTTSCCPAAASSPAGASTRARARRVGDSIITSAAANGTITGTGTAWVTGAPLNLIINAAPGRTRPRLARERRDRRRRRRRRSAVSATDPDGGNLDVTFFGRTGATGPAPAPFTFVTIPDTQNYSLSDTAATTYFSGQTQWIVEPADDEEHRVRRPHGRHH